MKTGIGRVVAVMAVAALLLALLAGSALAQTGTTDGSPSEDTGFGMMDQIDQGTWGEMIEHMIQVHGPETTAKMIEWMNEEDGDCPMEGGFPGMMGWGYGGYGRNGFGRNSYGGWMGHGHGGMMGWGTSGPGSWMGWGFHRPGSMMGGAYAR